MGRLNFFWTEKLNCITRSCTRGRLIAPRLTLRLIRIYERSVESRRRSAAFVSGGTDNCFPRRCTGNAYVWRGRADEHRRGKSSQTPPSPPPPSSLRAKMKTRWSLPAVTCTHARRHTWLRKKGRCREGERGEWASGPIVHACGWVGSLLKCKPWVFSRGVAERGERGVRRERGEREEAVSRLGVTGPTSGRLSVAQTAD